MDLLIISHTPHYRQAGRITGWGPTVREIDHLAALFDHVTHLAVLYDDPAPSSSLPYTAANVRLLPVRPAGGHGWMNKLDVVLAYPGYWRTMHRALSSLQSGDLVHVRCPANLSLLAVLQLTVSRQSSHRWIKYAGNWQPERRDPFSYKFQRWLLQHNLPRSVVTINGKWPGQGPHLVSFRNPCLEIDDLLDGQRCILAKSLSDPLRLLYVGGLEPGKGVFEAMEVARQLASAGIQFEFEVVGDGSERQALESNVRKAGLDGQIFFRGWVPKTRLAEFYDKAHFMIFPSRSEGWPKVLSEGMAYGVVPLAGAVSSIPQILQESGTGMALDPEDTRAFVTAILSYTQNPDRWKLESEAACRAAPKFTYEAYLEHLKAMFADQWGVTL